MVKDKEVLAFMAQGVGKKKLYITGHRVPDVDSYISSIILEGLLKQSDVNAEAVILVPYESLDKDLQGIIKLLDLKKLKAVTPDENMLWFLVDHNSPAESIGMDLKDNILGIFDHHKDTHLSEPSIKLNFVIGSTTHLLYAFARKNGYFVSKSTVFEMLIALLVDTNCLINSKTTDFDRQFVEKALKEYNYTMEQLFAITVFDLDLKLSVAELALNGGKTQETSGIAYGSSYLDLKGMNKQKEEKLAEIFKYLSLNTSKSLHYLLINDLEAKISIVRFYGKLAEDYSNVFSNIVFDYVASRGATVEPLVKQKIDDLIKIKEVL